MKGLVGGCVKYVGAIVVGRRVGCLVDGEAVLGLAEEGLLVLGIRVGRNDGDDVVSVNVTWSLRCSFLLVISPSTITLDVCILLVPTGMAG